MRAPDARERPLVAQERVELPPLAAEDLGEPLRAEAERVRAEVGELRLEPLGREQPDARAPLLARLGEHELAAVGEREAEHRRLRRLRAGRVVAEPAGAHQVDAEHELAVGGREEQVLAAAPRRPPASAPRAPRAEGRTSSRWRCGPARRARRAPARRAGRARAPRPPLPVARACGRSLPGMADPIQVEVTRGGVVEAVHTVHAVAVRDGQIVAEAGDPRLLTYPALLGQADPGAPARAGPRPISTTARSRSPAPRTSPAPSSSTPSARCSPRRPRPRPTSRRARSRRPIEHTCSGKHAGFLAVCRARGYETRGYRFASHPLQQELLAEVAAAAEVDPAAIPVAVDGCGVPTFALPLDRCAHAFARLPRLEGGPRVIAAMRAHPEMLRGPIAADAMFIRAARRLGCEGRCRGALLRLFVRRSGRRAEGRGRRLSRHSPCTCGLFGAARDRHRRARHRHGGKQPRGDGRGAFETRPESRVPKGRSRV